MTDFHPAFSSAKLGTFSDKSKLAQDLAACMMRWEAVPDIPFSADNTAAFVHELAPQDGGRLRARPSRPAARACSAAARGSPASARC